MSGPKGSSGDPDRIGARWFARLSKRNGRRQLLFLPGVVLKLGLDAPERRKLAIEAERCAAAARLPFWTGLPVRAVTIPGSGFVGRRFRAARPDDLDAVSRVVEDRLDSCARLPRRPMLEDLAHCASVLARLDGAERARLERLFDGQALPETSMHGDLHLFNFVRSDAGFRIIDWEHFDPRGSFVFDYVDFHVAVDHWSRKRYWPDTLGALDLDHRAIRRGAEVSGTSPRALRAYYLLRKVDKRLERHGGAEGLPRGEVEGLVAALRRAIAGIGPAFGDLAPLIV
jgi:hypothetical protein